MRSSLVFLITSDLFLMQKFSCGAIINFLNNSFIEFIGEFLLYRANVKGDNSFLCEEMFIMNTAAHMIRGILRRGKHLYRYTGTSYCVTGALAIML